MVVPPLARRWFRTEEAGPAITRIFEPHVHPLLRANAWHVRGAERDLFVDAGLGVASLRRCLPGLFERDPLLVITHAHLDHSGGAHEFGDVAVHSAEAGLVEHPPRGRLYAREICAELGITGAGLPELLSDLPELLVDAYPDEGFDPEGHTVRPASVTRAVRDGDLIDLGDRRFTVLHLPGHSPGGIALLDEAAGTLFSGDTLYDGTLLDDLHGSDVAAYAATMHRLLATDFTTVHPGHGGVLDRARARRIARMYLNASENR